MKRICILAFACIAAACSTAPKDDFNKVKAGMYKGDVLDMLGSPQESRFKGDQYIWTYKFLDETEKITREVHVKGDFVTYVGEPVAFVGDKFAKITKGMNKSEVLDLVGFPAKSEKKNGKDLWTYSSKSSNGIFQVQFDEDKVSTAGWPAPSSSAPASEPFEKIE